MTEIKRNLKKLFIVTLLLSFILIPWILMNKPKSTGEIEQKLLCSNGIKDKEEYGVDCGGVCENECIIPPGVQNIKIEWVKAVKDGKRNGRNNYDLVAKLSNSNKSWGVSNVDYKFIIYYTNGKTDETEKKQSYIMPSGPSKNIGYRYIIKDNFETEGKIEKVDLKLSNFNWNEIKSLYKLSELSNGIIKIINKKHGFYKNSRGYFASGVTKNGSVYGFYRVDINVALFDKNKEPIAVGKTDQWTMGAGEGWEFVITWTTPPPRQVYYAEYEAQTNVFYEENFMKNYKDETEHKEIPN